MTRFFFVFLHHKPELTLSCFCCPISDQLHCLNVRNTVNTSSYVRLEWHCFLEFLSGSVLFPYPYIFLGANLSLTCKSQCKFCRNASWNDWSQYVQCVSLHGKHAIKVYLLFGFAADLSEASWLMQNKWAGPVGLFYLLFERKQKSSFGALLGILFRWTPLSQQTMVFITKPFLIHTAAHHADIKTSNLL